MEQERKGWKRFKQTRLNRKKLARHVKRAEGATTRHAHRFLIQRIDNIRLVARELTTWLLLVGAIFAGLGFQLLWSQTDYMASARQPGGAYVEGALGQVDTLNPLFVSTSSEASVSRLVFSSLYNYDETGSLHTDLAKKMTIDSTGKLYTVTIRDDATWHDKTPLTAKDIVFTINLIKNPSVRSPLRVNWLDVSAVAINPTTVLFTLPATYAAFPYALTFPVLPEHTLKSVAPGAIRESAFSRSPIGSGPFVFRQLQAIDSISNHKVVHLAANDAYYGGTPKVARFELHSYETEDQLLQALRLGELSGAADVSVTSTSNINTKNYTLTPQAVDSGVYLLLNVNNPILQDQKVRAALQAGTDVGLLRKELGGGVQPLDGPLLDGQISGADVPHAAPADLIKAQQLLDEAGWKIEGSTRKKDGRPLELTITTKQDKEYEKVIGFVDQQWTKLGIKVNKNVVDTSSVASAFIQNTLQARNFDVLLYKLSIGADPDVYAYWHSSQIGQTGYNFSSYSNKAADASLASARSRLEPELRNAKYKQFVRQWLSDVPAIALYQPVLEYVSNSNVSAVMPGTRLVDSSDRYANVLDWSVNNGTVYKTP